MIKISAKRFLKDQEDILNDLTDSLQKNGFSTHNGSVCMLFASIISVAIASIYTLLEKCHLNCFVSSADKEHLIIMAKDIGIDVDDSFSEKEIRSLITNHIKFYNSTSKWSIVEKLLNSDKRITDVKIKEFTKGAGTFCAYIYSSSQSQDILSNAKSVLDRSVPCGCVYDVKFPKVSVVTIKVSVITSNILTLSKEIELRHSINSSIRQALSVIDKNGITKYDVEREIYACDKYITDVNIRSIEVDGVSVQIIPSIIGVSYELSQMTEILL